MATIRFNQLVCVRPQDQDGADEAFMAVFIDGDYAGNIFQRVRAGDVIRFGFELEYVNEIVVQLWEIDNPNAGNPHDYLGGLRIGTNSGSGNGEFNRSGAQYRLEWEVAGVPDPTSPPVVVPTSTIAIRRDQDTLTRRERERFLEAVNALISDQTFGDLVIQHAGPSGTFEFHNHSFVAPASVSRERFLPWHRVYLRRLEEALLNIDTNLFLPYWRGWADRNIPNWLDAFTPSVSLPTAIPGQANPLPVTRNPGGSGMMPRVSDINRELEPSDFTQMTTRLEGGSHGMVHVWTGGNMRNALIASSDILFWLHHCEIDRLWFIWQRNNTDLPTLTGSNRTMQPWNEDVIEVMDIEEMGYTYA